MVSSKGEPIRNPVTGAEHRVRIDFPQSFEYKLGEIGSGTSKVTGPLADGAERQLGAVRASPSQPQRPAELGSLNAHGRIAP